MLRSDRSYALAVGCGPVLGKVVLRDLNRLGRAHRRRQQGTPSRLAAISFRSRIARSGNRGSAALVCDGDPAWRLLHALRADRGADFARRPTGCCGLHLGQRARVPAWLRLLAMLLAEQSASSPVSAPSDRRNAFVVWVLPAVLSVPCWLRVDPWFSGLPVAAGTGSRMVCGSLWHAGVASALRRFSPAAAPDDRPGLRHHDPKPIRLCPGWARGRPVCGRSHLEEPRAVDAPIVGSRNGARSRAACDCR